MKRQTLQKGRTRVRISGIAAAAVLAIMSAAEAGPVITSIGGATDTSAGIKNGLVDMSIGTAYNGYRVVNDQPGIYTWTIYGSGFGSSSGTVQLAGRTVPLVSWTNTAVKINVSGAQINPTKPWDWGPMSTTLRLRTTTGVPVDKGVAIVPAIRTRIFGQCTYHVALRRLQMGKVPSPTAYGGYTTITSTWVPRPGDQLQWPWYDGKHAGIVESVTGPTTTNGVTTYQVRISQRNAKGNNEYSEVTSPFSFKAGTVLKKPLFSTGGTTQATSYYR